MKKAPVMLLIFALYGCGAMRVAVIFPPPYASLEDARAAYFEANAFSPKELEALEWWRKYSAKEVEEIDSIESAKEAYSRAPKNSREEQEAYYRWRVLIRPEFKTIKDYESAHRVYMLAPPGSEEETGAMWLMFIYKDAVQI